MYSYISGGANDGQMLNVTVSRDPGTGFVENRRVRFEYYGSSDANGSLNDLKRIVTQFKCPSEWTDHDVLYFRYYKGTSSSSSSGGSTPYDMPHGLKLAVGPQGYVRGTLASVNWDTATDTTVKGYADHYVEFDSNRRVTKNVIASGGFAYTYAYLDSSFGDGFNNWKRRTIRTAPDGDQLRVYTNYVGQVMLEELSSGSSKWIEHQQFDGSDSYLTVRVRPSGINMTPTSPTPIYTESTASMNVQLRASAGRFELWEYGTPSGQPAGYLTFSKVREGTDGSAATVVQFTYSSLTAGSVTLQKLTRESVFKFNTVPNTGEIHTDYTDTFFTGTAGVNTRLVQLPTVSTGQNGTGSNVFRRELYDKYGNLTAFQDERGYITTFSFDLPTGVGKQIIRDAAVPSGSGWTRPTGAPSPLALTTNNEVDDEGRVTQSLGPEHEVDLGPGIGAKTVRTASWNVYKDHCGTTYDETWSGRGYYRTDNTTYYLVNPASISRAARDGLSSDSITATRGTNVVETGKLTENDTLTNIRRSQSIYNNQGQMTASRLYTNLSGAGTYNETLYIYNPQTGQQNGVKTPGGTITRTKFDARGLLTETWVGTIDTGFSPLSGNNFNTTGTQNLTKVSSSIYDGGTDGKNGNLTSTTAYVVNGATGARTMTFNYDYRDRQILAASPDATHVVPTYDNLGRVTATQRYVTSGTELIGQQQTDFDDLGRVYESRVYSVDSGTPGPALVDKTWHDDAGNVIKQISSSSEAFTKTDYDAVGRSTSYKIGFNDGTHDRIFAQTDNLFDKASNLTQTSQFSRFHDDSSTTSGLDVNNSRPNYTAFYPDAIGRQRAVAVYGTNGGSSLSRSPTVPSRSDTVLVTSTTYDIRGDAETTTDPRGIVAKDEFDVAGRRVRHLDNYLSASSSSSGACTTDDANVTTEWTYNTDSRVATATAVNASTGNQTTTYTYGVLSSGGSDITSNDLLQKTTFADGSKAQFLYNTQGERKRLTDQNGTIHDYTFDTSGRVIADTVTFPSSSSSSSSSLSAIDQTVNKLGWTFDIRGRLQKATTYKTAGGVQNEIFNEYNGLNMLVKQYQEHLGAVPTPPGTTLAVSFAFDTASISTSNGGVYTKGLRSTSLTYPNGRLTHFNYGTTGAADDRLARLYEIRDNDNATVLARYSYLGLGRVVVDKRPQPDIQLDYTASASGDQKYPGLDKFDRVKIQKWTKTGVSDPIDHFEYRYDRNSNPLCQKNYVLTGKDELYAYDALNRLVDFKRGTLATLDPPTMTTAPVRQETFGLDASANWKCYDIGGSEPAALNQLRASNKLNEIIAITETAGQAQWVDPTYDTNGNMTKCPQPNNLTAGYDIICDAWNRVVEIKTSNPGTVAKYEYDAQNRRTMKYVVASGLYTHFYYAGSGALLETRVGASPSTIPSTYDQQYVLAGGGPMMYDRSLGSSSSSSSSGTPNPSRLFLTTSGGGDTTAISTHTGTPIERYIYGAYGSVVVMATDGAPVAGNVSAFTNNAFLAGRYFDNETGLYISSDHYLHSALGALVAGINDDGVWWNIGPDYPQRPEYNYDYHTHPRTPGESPDEHDLVRRWLDGQKCCVKEVKRTVTKKMGQYGDARAQHFGAEFKLVAKFSNKYPCWCKCCEFRQFVQSTAQLTGTMDGRPVTQYSKVTGSTTAEGAITRVEDSDKTGRSYGHRSDAGQDGDKYSSNGCEYEMSDFPGVANYASSFAHAHKLGIRNLVFSFAASFDQQIIDTCNGNTVIWSDVLEMKGRLLLEPTKGTIFEDVTKQPSDYQKQWN